MWVRACVCVCKGVSVCVCVRIAYECVYVHICECMCVHVCLHLGMFACETMCHYMNVYVFGDVAMRRERRGTQRIP